LNRDLPPFMVLKFSRPNSRKRAKMKRKLAKFDISGVRSYTESGTKIARIYRLWFARRREPGGTVRLDGCTDAL
jgi:hypothetical protein